MLNCDVPLGSIVKILWPTVPCISGKSADTTPLIQFEKPIPHQITCLIRHRILSVRRLLPPLRRNHQRNSTRLRRRQGQVYVISESAINSTRCPASCRSFRIVPARHHGLAPGRRAGQLSYTADRLLRHPPRQTRPGAPLRPTPGGYGKHILRPAIQPGYRVRIAAGCRRPD